MKHSNGGANYFTSPHSQLVDVKGVGNEFVDITDVNVSTTSIPTPIGQSLPNASSSFLSSLLGGYVGKSENRISVARWSQVVPLYDSYLHFWRRKKHAGQTRQTADFETSRLLMTGRI